MRKILSLILVLALCLPLAACAKESPIPTTEAPVETTAAVETEPAYYPLTVTDQAGREVTIESQPQRIVSGYYISSSLLIALGQADKLVGIEAKADKRPIYALSAPQLLDLPSVGSAKEFDLEGCAALEPDLVILPMKLKETAETLTNLGIPTILVNPENMGLLNEAREMLAAALNCEEQANALREFSKFDETAKCRLADEKPTVYMGGNSSFLSTAGGNMFQSELITYAGGQNVAAEIEDSYWAEVSYEQILAWNPDYIILAADASYTVEDVLNDSNLAGITAIEEGRVYQMPGKAEAWDSPVPSSILGELWLGSVLHPEYVTESFCSETIEEFYETFYGFSYAES